MVRLINPRPEAKGKYSLQLSDVSDTGDKLCA